MSYYPEPRTSINIILVELVLPNYATKFHLQKTTGFDTLQSSKKYDLANFKIICWKTRSWWIKKSIKCFKQFEK